jgi:hypothetical protein
MYCWGERTSPAIGRVELGGKGDTDTDTHTSADFEALLLLGFFILFRRAEGEKVEEEEEDVGG